MISIDKLITLIIKNLASLRLCVVLSCTADSILKEAIAFSLLSVIGYSKHIYLLIQNQADDLIDVGNSDFAIVIDIGTTQQVSIGSTV